MVGLAEHMGSIADIPDPKARFAHVAKHLYASRERWDLIVPALPADALPRAVESGCDRRNLARDAPSWYGTCQSCREHLLADHDRYYQPAYRGALTSALAASRHGCMADGAEALVGDSGVFVIAKRSEGKRHVASAYRVVPRGIPPERAAAEDFFRAAERKLKDKTSYAQETP
jgi:hypothetical protein